MWQVFIAIVVITYFLFFKKPKESEDPKLQSAKRLTGPRGWPVLGSSLELFFLVPPTEFLKKLEVYRKKFGDVYEVMFGPQKWLIVSDPKDLEIILTTQDFINKANDYDLFRPWLLDSLMTSKGEKWRYRRRVLNTSFHFQILDSFMDVFNEQSRLFIDHMKKIGTDYINIEPECSKFTLDVLCEAGLGYKLKGLTKDSNYYLATERIKQITYARYMSPIYKYPILFRWTKTYKEYYKHINYVHSMTDKWIQERKKYWAEKGGLIQEVDPDTGAKRRMAFLDSLLMTKPEIPHDGLMEEVTNFAFAGHDTSSSVMAFTIYNLARNPDVQAKLFEEIRSVFGDDPSGDVLPEHVNQLKYLDLCLKETLRLHTPAPLIGRQVPRDIVVNGKFYPKEAGILCGLYLTCHDDRYFPEPFKYIPERFEAEASDEKLKPFVYLPFSAGPRNCLGQKFAHFELKVTIAQLIRNLEFETDLTQPEADTRFILVLKSEKGLYVRFKPRVYA